MLRWGHFFLFALAAIGHFCQKNSPVPSIEEQEGPGLDREGKMVRIIHRDGSKKLFARILSIISVFLYQGTVFYAQMVLV